MSKIKKHIPAIVAVLFVILGVLVPILKNTIKPEPEKYTLTYIDVFDTASQIIGYDKSAEAFKEKADILKAELETYHQLYNIYSVYEGVNNLKIININAGIEPVKVDKKIIDLLKFSIDLYHKTDGEVNIALGSVLSIWHDYRTAGIADPSSAELPPLDKLQEAAKHTDINNIIIDEEASTVYLADPEMSLDVGSIGKGYAVQMVAEYAKELGYNNMIINVGGNAITVGTHANGDNWRIAIQNPDLEASDPVIKRVLFADKCLVTSGDYQRYYTVDGVEYCHIIDPDTLMPPSYFSAVSIICDHSGLADALSTALFNMSHEDGLALINSIENAEAMWVLKDGTIMYSENFEEYIVE
ncbi:MAG: FAD:protein FMN transferase [Agathobacter sp.]|nr:FAD:protein FMN transferase [Agathobacter sp.]MBQ3559122.1 FAD:protein FMN transferase [Agathobacter sp.]